MTLEEIERLLRRLERTNITSVEITDETSSLKLCLAPGRAGRVMAPIDAPPPAAPLAALCAGAIGRLRLAHPEAAQPADMTYPRAVRAGDIVAFLEAGSFLRPVVVEHNGMIGAPLAPEGSLVGYGTPLFPILSPERGMRPAKEIGRRVE